MATRDRPDMVARAARSIAEQRFTDFEVVVVDDGSSASARVEYERHLGELGPRFRLDCAVPPGAPGTGPAAVRNRGLKHAAGRYVAFLDDDDRWCTDDHLDVAVESLELSGAEWFFSDARSLRGNRVELQTWFPQPPEAGRPCMHRGRPDVFRLDVASLMGIFRHHMVHPDSWVVRRDLFERVGDFNERLRFVEDLELGMRLADAAGSVVYRATPTVEYRLPEGDAESLKYDRVTILLQYILAAQTLRTVCRTRAFRRCARAREAWAMRQLASELGARGAEGARSFSWQALATFPTLGALAECLLPTTARR